MSAAGDVASALQTLTDQHGVLATSVHFRRIYLTEYTFRREFPEVEATDGRYEKEINGITFVAKEKAAHNGTA